MTRRQRDALRSEVVWMLNGASDDFGSCLVSWEDFDQAQGFRQDIEDWSALFDDLGWAPDDPRESFCLTLPRERLDRVLERLREWAGTTLLSHALNRLDDDEQAERAVIIGEACGDITRALLAKRDASDHVCPRRSR